MLFFFNAEAQTVQMLCRGFEGKSLSLLSWYGLAGRFYRYKNQFCMPDETTTNGISFALINE